MKIFIFSNLTKNHPKGSGPSGTRPQVVITTFECMRIQQIFPSTNFLQRRIQRLFEHRSRPSGPQVFPVRRCFWYAGTSIELQVPFAAVRSQFAAVGSQFAAPGGVVSHRSMKSGMQNVATAALPTLDQCNKSAVGSGRFLCKQIKSVGIRSQNPYGNRGSGSLAPQSWHWLHFQVTH